MATVKRAVSLDRQLDAKADSTARNMHISRSRLHAIALDEFIRRIETKEFMERMNEACAGELDEEDRKFLQGAGISLARIWQEEDSQG